MKRGEGKIRHYYEYVNPLNEAQPGMSGTECLYSGETFPAPLPVYSGAEFIQKNNRHSAK